MKTEEELTLNGVPAGALDPDDDPGKFSVAPEVQAIANRLMTDVQRFGHLTQARILYLWRNGGWKSKGRHVLGRAYILNEEQRFLTGADLKVIVNREMWEKATPLQQDALVAHELCHFEPIDDDKDGNPRWRNALHDVEEFAFIVRKYGLWDESLRMFEEARAEGELERKQLHMFEEAENEDDMNVVQKEWGLNPTEEEPQATPEDDADRLPAEDVAQGAEQPGTHKPNVLSEHHLALLDESYEGTDLRVYACRGNWNKDQLAEAAFQGGLPKCVIRLTREVARGDDTVDQVNEYFWDGDRQIERLTAAKKPGFLRDNMAESA